MRSSSISENDLVLSTFYFEHGNQRNLLKNLRAKIVGFFVPDAVEISMMLLAKGLETLKVRQEGIFKVDSNFELSKPTSLKNGNYFMFIHGTNSNTKGAFNVA